MTRFVSYEVTVGNFLTNTLNVAAVFSLVTF